MQFRKKPVIIEAVRIEPDMLWPDWFREAVSEDDIVVHGQAKFFDGRRYIEIGSVEIKTLEGTMRGDLGDWIIRGIAGEIYPCKPEIFEATYEAV